jgi:hypothetical protein
MCKLTHSMAGERQGNGMGAAWTQHAMCESVFSLFKLVTSNIPALNVGMITDWSNIRNKQSTKTRSERSPSNDVQSFTRNETKFL